MRGLRLAEVLFCYVNVQMLGVIGIKPAGVQICRLSRCASDSDRVMKRTTLNLSDLRFVVGLLNTMTIVARNIHDKPRMSVGFYL